MFQYILGLATGIGLAYLHNHQVKQALKERRK